MSLASPFWKSWKEHVYSLWFKAALDVFFFGFLWGWWGNSRRRYYRLELFFVSVSWQCCYPGVVRHDHKNLLWNFTTPNLKPTKIWMSLWNVLFGMTHFKIFKPMMLILSGSCFLSKLNNFWFFLQIPQWKTWELVGCHVDLSKQLKDLWKISKDHV